MTKYPKGELLLVGFPFVTGAAMKRRAALVILDTGDADVVLARVTTRPIQAISDVSISDWTGAGLLAPSTVRLHKLVTLEKSLVVKSLGALQPNDRQSVAKVLAQHFCTW